MVPNACPKAWCNHKYRQPTAVGGAAAVSSGEGRTQAPVGRHCQSVVGAAARARECCGLSSDAELASWPSDRATDTASRLLAFVLACWGLNVLQVCRRAFAGSAMQDFAGYALIKILRPVHR
jgi:hypothetical protein